VAFSPKDELVAVGVAHFGVRVISVRTHEEVLTLPHPSLNVHVAFGPSGLLGAASGNVTKLWSLQTGKEVRKLLHQRSASALAFSPDGRWIATGVSGLFFPGEVRVWSLLNGQELARVTHSRGINSLAFSPNSQFLASGSDDSATSIWQIPTGREVSRFAPQEGSVRSIAFSPNGRHVLSNSGRTAWLWEFDSQEALSGFDSGDRVGLLAFSPGEGRFLVWTTNKGPAFVWDRVARTRPKKIPSGSGEQLALSRDGPLFANIALESGNTINIRNLATGKVVMRLKDIAPAVPRIWSSINAVALSLDGRRVAVAALGQVTVWDVATKKRITQRDYDSEVWRIAFSPKGNLLGVGEDNGRVTVWDIENKEAQKLSPIRHPNRITGIAFSPDGNRIATSSGELEAPGQQLPGEHRISNVRHETTVSRVAHAHQVRFILFSPNGRRIATITGGIFSRRGEVTVWDVEGGAKLSTFAVEGSNDSVAFSQDGEWITGVGLAGDAVVWQAISGQIVFRQTFSSPVASTAFSPDDAAVAIGTENGKIYLTPWRTDALIAAACKRLTANLSCNEWKDHFTGEKYHATCAAVPRPGKCD
jgi:WD40 repeat protein